MTNQPLHVFLRRCAANTQVAALSGVALPDCYERVHAADLQVAQRQSARLRAEAGPDGCTVFVDIEVLIDNNPRIALLAAQRLGPPSGLRYVGTPQGLAGYISDLHALGIADGVTLIPGRAADNTGRLINDVLPTLGLDRADLAA